MTSPMNRKRPLPISDLEEEIQDHYYHPDQASHPQEESEKMMDSNNGKRRRCTTTSMSSTTDHEGLLTDLSGVLDQIRSTQISGEIPAESLESLKMLMLQIEHLSSDVSNTEARHMKHESERQLEQWFDDLLEQCEAEGGLDLDYLMNNDHEDGMSDDEEEDTLALALALLDEEEQEREEQEFNITSPSQQQQHLSDTNSETTVQEIDVVA
ncbi:hypothetical protein INT45_007571 [Circinella minor]|uniref:Uncharacterized protein n=1 Tax=Circinella minor TaxID=1195481 RepID=A0A8H7S4Q3_9FUNG|nr:hypothetical protein INT45_007571 [Circinella minor]